MKNIPKLRFPEFVNSGEWEENCILNIASMKARIGWQNLRQEEHLEQGDYYLVTGTDFSFNKVDWLNAKFVSYERYIQDKHIILKEGDILITKDGSIGKVAYVENIEDKNATLNNGIFRIRINHENSKFIFYTFLSSRFKTFLDKLSGGSSIVHLYQKDFEKYEIAYPSLQEQQKIADCLSSLDSLILAQSQKAELLKEHKKALMQQLFPQDTEEVPKLRFPEFKNAPKWEEKKLGNLLDYEQPTNYLVSDTNYNDSFEIPVLTAGKTFILGYTNETHGIFQNPLPVIIFDDFTTATQFVDFPFKAKSSAMKILKPKNDFGNIKIIFELMQTIEYQANEHKRYWISEYQNLEIKLPSPKEQQKIANFLSSIDEQISRQTSKLQTLKEHKKALMQQLFPTKEAQQ